MSWLCLNCETVNFDNDLRCIVCNDERYYKASEVKDLIEQNPDAQSAKEEVKKVTKHIKWLQTRNKTLTQENKTLIEERDKILVQLKSKEEEVQVFNHNEQEILQLNQYKKQIKQLKISTAVLLLTSLLLGLLHII